MALMHELLSHVRLPASVRSNWPLLAQTNGKPADSPEVADPAGHTGLQVPPVEVQVL
jgi:hypothetical protein